MHPSRSNTARFASTTTLISASTGTPPRSRHHAMRAPLTLRSRRDAKRDPPSGIESGVCGSEPARTLKRSATSDTVRAIGPDTENGDHVGASLGTRPGDGRKPTTLQNAAGFRSEPPVSLPSAMGTIPAANATAAPPLLPPQVLARSYGL